MIRGAAVATESARWELLRHASLFFCLDDDLDSYLVALDKYTGKQSWLAKRPEMLGGYSVPVVVTSGKQTDTSWLAVES